MNIDLEASALPRGTIDLFPANKLGTGKAPQDWSPASLNIDLKASATFPGEGVVVALIEAWKTSRATMSQENRDGFDKLTLAQCRGWHNFWITLGWPGEKI